MSSSSRSQQPAPAPAPAPASEPATASNANNAFPFLELPLELVREVMSLLTPVDITILSTVCRDLRSITRMFSLSTNLTPRERLDFLARYSWNLPDYFVCARCSVLHRVRRRDVPTELMSRCSPSRGPDGIEPAWEQKKPLGNTYFAIEHHHVELTLKYSRLQLPEYQSYLEALLEPYYGENPMPYGDFGEAKYSAFPKVVTDSNGELRYLLLSIWRYLEYDRFTLDDLVELRNICPHLDSEFYFLTGRTNANLMLWTIERALTLRHEGEEMTGFCPRCPTDYAVCLGSGDLHIYVWQDLGPQTAASDMVWQAQTQISGLFPGEAGPSRSESVWHEQGSVKRVYLHPYKDEPII
ncbi:hypothetical protein GGR50DRAFT_665151 [Xylaria sp. CBS 124048]|nr:hypothetical protein GGR50DRAFT_665151 [Xylaria sp. CBS 124048]